MMIDNIEIAKQRDKSINIGNKKVLLSCLEMYTNNWLHGIGEGIPASPYDTLELIVSPDCNLKCKYCYLHQHNKELYPMEIRDNETIFNNAHKLIKWIIKNDYRPNLDLFTGEAFGQEVCFRVLDMIADEYKKVEPHKRPRMITIPTNFTFIASKEITQRVHDLHERYQEDLGIDFCLSASVEGKYMEQNRPFKCDLDIPIMGGIHDKRDDAYYEDVFKFVATHNCGMHPMIYSKDIELWKKNFLWFQDMMAKHDIHWTNVMLLQVRNEEWTANQIKDFQEFTEWCMEWTLNKCKLEGIDFVDSIRDDRSQYFSLLTQGLGSSQRGISCSIQSCVGVRLGDLAWVPCHRTMYPGLEYGILKFNDEGDMIDVEANKVELLATIMGMTSKAFYGCSSCHMNELCLGQCLGACYESLGSMFTPIPTVCSMTQAGLVGLTKVWLKHGIFDKITHLCANRTQTAQWKILKEMVQDGKLQ